MQSKKVRTKRTSIKSSKTQVNKCRRKVLIRMLNRNQVKRSLRKLLKLRSKSLRVKMLMLLRKFKTFRKLLIMSKRRSRKRETLKLHRVEFKTSRDLNQRLIKFLLMDFTVKSPKMKFSRFKKSLVLIKQDL